MVVHTRALCRGEILPFVVSVEQECLFSSLYSIPCALCSASVFILILGLAALGCGPLLFFLSVLGSFGHGRGPAGVVGDGGLGGSEAFHPSFLPPAERRSEAGKIGVSRKV